MDVDPKLIAEVGIGGFAVYSLVGIAKFFVVKLLENITAHNAAVVEEMKKVSVAVEKNTEKVTSLMMALIGQDIVELKKRINGQAKE